jgi:hypothetical protein
MLAVFGWGAITWTRDKPLPEILLFPAPELLLLNMLALPGMMYAMLLLVGAHDLVLRLLGMVSTLLLLVVLGAVGTLSVWLALNKQQLGLEYELLEDQLGLSASLRQKLAGLPSLAFGAVPLLGSMVSSRLRSQHSGMSQKEELPALNMEDVHAQSAEHEGSGPSTLESKRCSSQHLTESASVRGSHGFWRPPPALSDYPDLRKAGGTSAVQLVKRLWFLAISKESNEHAASSLRQEAPGEAQHSNAALQIALFTRLGMLFLDFKGSPWACVFYAVKLAMRAMKGAVVGAFYGESL